MKMQRNKPGKVLIAITCLTMLLVMTGCTERKLPAREAATSETGVAPFTFDIYTRIIPWLPQ
jgi:hypothetical protein